MSLLGDVSWQVVLISLLSIPLALSGWAFLDAARRPRWAWALANRDQVIWMASILFGIAILPLGLFLSLYYLWNVRPQIAAAEAGDFPTDEGSPASS